MTEHPRTPDQLDALASGWTVISAAFADSLNPDTVAALRSPEQLDLWPLPGASFEEARIEFAASAELADAQESLEALRLAHQRRFSGPGRVDPSPWESVHRSLEGLIFDEHTFDVRRRYAEFGLQSVFLNRVPEDHVAVEAEFLAFLLTRALDAIDAESSEATHFVAGFDRFLTEHALRWLPDYFRVFQSQAETHYHRGIALLGRQVLADSRS